MREPLKNCMIGNQTFITTKYNTVYDSVNCKNKTEPLRVYTSATQRPTTCHRIRLSPETSGITRE